MDSFYQKAIALYESKPKDSRIIIGLAGPPGAGKTTTAFKVCEKINDLLGNGKAMVVPMDGYHIPRDKLRTMENPEYLFKRRGAPFTFDPEGLLAMLKKLKENKELVSQNRKQNLYLAHSLCLTRFFSIY